MLTFCVLLIGLGVARGDLRRRSGQFLSVPELAAITLGTALQVFVAYMFGAAMVLWSGVAVIALLLGALFVSGITSNAHDLHQSGKPRLRVVVVPPAVLVSLSSVDETFLGSKTIRELYRDTISKTYLETRCPTGPEVTR